MSSVTVRKYKVLKGLYQVLRGKHTGRKELPTAVLLTEQNQRHVLLLTDHGQLWFAQHPLRIARCTYWNTGGPHAHAEQNGLQGHSIPLHRMQIHYGVNSQSPN